MTISAWGTSGARPAFTTTGYQGVSMATPEELARINDEVKRLQISRKLGAPRPVSPFSESEINRKIEEDMKSRVKEKVYIGYHEPVIDEEALYNSAKFIIKNALRNEPQWLGLLTALTKWGESMVPVMKEATRPCS